MRYLIILMMLIVSGCGSMSEQKVSYVDSGGVPRDSLGRDATDAGIPLCSEVTLKDKTKECRIR